MQGNSALYAWAAEGAVILCITQEACICLQK